MGNDNDIGEPEGYLASEILKRILGVVTETIDGSISRRMTEAEKRTQLLMQDRMNERVAELRKEVNATLEDYKKTSTRLEKELNEQAGIYDGKLNSLTIGFERRLAEAKIGYDKRLATLTDSVDTTLKRYGNEAKVTAGVLLQKIEKLERDCASRADLEAEIKDSNDTAQSGIDQLREEVLRFLGDFSSEQGEATEKLVKGELKRYGITQDVEGEVKEAVMIPSNESEAKDFFYPVGAGKVVPPGWKEPDSKKD